MLDLSQKEDFIDQLFSTLLEKKDTLDIRNVFLIEIWHFLGCVRNNGIHEFISYSNIDITAKALRFFDMNSLSDNLQCLIREYKTLSLNHSLNSRYENFEKQLDVEYETLIDRIYSLSLNYEK